MRIYTNVVCLFLYPYLWLSPWLVFLSLIYLFHVFISYSSTPGKTSYQEITEEKSDVKELISRLQDVNKTNQYLGEAAETPPGMKATIKPTPDINLTPVTKSEIRASAVGTLRRLGQMKKMRETETPMSPTIDFMTDTHSQQGRHKRYLMLWSISVYLPNCLPGICISLCVCLPVCLFYLVAFHFIFSCKFVGKIISDSLNRVGVTSIHFSLTACQLINNALPFYTQDNGLLPFFLNMKSGRHVCISRTVKVYSGV